MNLIRKLAVVIVVLLLPILANGSAIYEQAPDLTTYDAGSFSYLGLGQTITQQLSDQFTLSKDALLFGVQWYGSFVGNADPSFESPEFIIRFFNDVGGAPAADAFYETIVTPLMVNTGRILLDQIAWEFSALTLPPILVEANTQTWTSILENSNDCCVDTFRWNISTPGPVGAIRQHEGGDWTVPISTSRSQTAYSLYGIPVSLIPEPGTLALLTIGFVGMRLARRTRLES